MEWSAAQNRIAVTTRCRVLLQSSTYLSFEEIFNEFWVEILWVSLHVERAVEVVWRLRQIQEKGEILQKKYHIMKANYVVYQEIMHQVKQETLKRYKVRILLELKTHRES
jgi:hypothetical protein